MNMQLRLLGAAVGLAWTAAVAAQDFPTKPVRMIVPSAPGGSTDIIARAIAPKLASVLGQPVVVDNKPGAGSMIGTRALLQAPPDGHTLMVNFPSVITSSLAYKSAGYTMSQLVPVAPIINQDFVFSVSQNLPVRTLQEFVAYAKKNPGKVNIVSLGAASITQLAVERFKYAAGIEVTSIPYPGTAPALTAMIAGTVDACLACTAPGQVNTYAQQIRPLAITSAQRSSFAPHVPTFKEQGFPSLVVPGWTALFAPAALPKPVLGKLRDAMKLVMADETVKAQLRGAGLEVAQGSVEEFSAQVERETRDWQQDIQRIGLQLN